MTRLLLCPVLLALTSCHEAPAVACDPNVERLEDENRQLHTDLEHIECKVDELSDKIDELVDVVEAAHGSD